MLSRDARRKKKDVILNFFEQLMQIAMSQEIYLERTRLRTKLICQEPDADTLSFVKKKIYLNFAVNDMKINNSN